MLLHHLCCLLSLPHCIETGGVVVLLLDCKATGSHRVTKELSYALVTTLVLLPAELYLADGRVVLLLDCCRFIPQATVCKLTNMHTPHCWKEQQARLQSVRGLPRRTLVFFIQSAHCHYDRFLFPCIVLEHTVHVNYTYMYTTCLLTYIFSF